MNVCNFFLNKLNLETFVNVFVAKTKTGPSIANRLHKEKISDDYPLPSLPPLSPSLPPSLLSDPDDRRQR